MIDTLWQEVRDAARSLAHRPLMSAVAVVSLALGIGVNTTVFSVFERLLLRPLPVPAADEIVTLSSAGPRPGWTSTSSAGDSAAIFSYPLFRDLEALEGTGLVGIAAHREFAANLAYRGRTSSGVGLLVSGGYFPLLRITPAIGRLLTRDDDLVARGHPVVVLSHSYWVTRFGADPAVLDDTLTVNGQPLTIVGVAPAGFTGTVTLERPQLFVPLAMAGPMRPGWARLQNRDDHWLYLFGRLAPGVSLTQAEDLFDIPFGTLTREVEYPLLRRGMGDASRELFQARRMLIARNSRGRNTERDNTRTLLLLLSSITGLVLLIACANVANLLLARAADRSGEVAVRMLLGASVARVARFLLTEALLLGALGGVAALGVANATVELLRLAVPVDDPTLLTFESNRSVVLFACGLGLLTGLVFGLAAALHGARATVSGVLGAQAGRTSGSRRVTRFRASLAAAQIALAMALLTQAGLFAASLANVSRVELGIHRERLLTFRLSPYLNGYTPERALAIVDRVEDELRGTPDIVSVGASTIPLLADTGDWTNVTVDGFVPEPDADTTVNVANVGTGYFEAVGVPLLAGRSFADADAGASAKVAIVNEAFARKFKLGSAIVGRRMAKGAGDVPLNIEIVGLVRDASYSQVREAPPPQLFRPYRQEPFASLTFYVRTRSDPRQLFTTVRAIVARLDATLPVDHLRTMDEQIGENTSRDRILTALSSLFAGLASLLAGIGLYAVLAYAVSQRMREIGIRMALGARALDVRWMVLAQVGRITIAGGVVGTAIAVGLGQLGQAVLFGLDGFDARIAAGAAALVAGVALAAGVLPARRAATVNPVEALRAE